MSYGINSAFPPAAKRYGRGYKGFKNSVRGMAKYNIFETYETMGRFWFDEAKEDKYPGVLEYLPAE